MLGEVAGVDADAREGHPGGPRRGDRVGHAALDVVGVDEEHREPGILAEEGLERGPLAGGPEGENVVVGHGPGGGDTEAAARDRGRRPRRAGDVRRPRHPQGRVGPVEAAQREVPHRPAGGGVDDPRRLARDQGLVVDDREQRGLDERRLDPPRGDPEKRDLGADHRPLGDRLDPPGEPQPGEVVDEVALIDPLPGQPLEVGGLEAEALEVGERLLEPGGDQVAAPRGEAADEELEAHLAVEPAVEERLGHGELVLVAVQPVPGVGEGQRPRVGHSDPP